MKPSLLLTALAAALALPAHAAEPATAAAADPMVKFTDGPTGFNFVWQRDAGWTFVGQSHEAAAKGGLVKASLTSSGQGFEEGAPLAEFLDVSTGFRFVWRHGSGWQFAGVATSRREAAQQIAAVADDLR